MHILEFLADFPIKKVNEQPIDFEYVNSNIENTLKELRNIPHIKVPAPAPIMKENVTLNFLSGKIEFQSI